MIPFVLALGVQASKEGKFYIYCVSISHIKVFFTGDGWSENINEKVETDDVKFAIESLREILEDRGLIKKLESSIEPFQF